MSFTVEERGRPNTQEYRVFFSKHSSLNEHVCLLLVGLCVIVALLTSYLATTTAVLRSTHRASRRDLLTVFLFVLKNPLLLFTEDSAGKYISPFHDIPIYADEAEVSAHAPRLTLQVFAVAVFRFIKMPLVASLMVVKLPFLVSFFNYYFLFPSSYSCFGFSRALTQ